VITDQMRELTSLMLTTVRRVIRLYVLAPPAARWRVRPANERASAGSQPAQHSSQSNEEAHGVHVVLLVSF
jgi:hypothetical protein